MAAQEARAFADEWLRGWNEHDVEAVLSHFAEDAVFSSPMAARLMPETRGILRGKPAIREYWTLGLEQIPDLHFEIENVYAGVSIVVINYRNHTGSLVNEVLEFNGDGLVQEGAGTYLE